MPTSLCWVLTLNDGLCFSIGTLLTLIWLWHLLTLLWLWHLIIRTLMMKHVFLPHFIYQAASFSIFGCFPHHICILISLSRPPLFGGISFSFLCLDCVFPCCAVLYYGHSSNHTLVSVLHGKPSLCMSTLLLGLDTSCQAFLMCVALHSCIGVHNLIHAFPILPMI